MRQARGVWVFLAISFGVAWGFWFGTYLAGWSLENPLVQLPGAFAPALAAVVVRRWVTREGFRDAGLGLRLRRAWRHYLVAWLGPPVMLAAALGLAAVLGQWQVDLAPLDELVPGVPGWGFLLLLLAVPPLLAVFFWGEDFGWNGYLLQRIFVRRPHLAVLGTGLIWAVWHYPLAFFGYIEFPNVAVGLALWTLAIVMIEVVLAWLRTRSRSIWPVTIWHAGENMVVALVAGLLLTEAGGLGPITVALLLAAPMLVLCAWIIGSGQFRGGLGLSPRSRADKRELISNHAYLP